MQYSTWIDRLLGQALQAGFETAEAYLVQSDSFRAQANDGEIVDYQVSSAAGLGFRGQLNGRMGYASTQAMDEKAIGQLIEGARDSAMLVETEDPCVIHGPEESYPECPGDPDGKDDPSDTNKLLLCREMDRLVKAADPRVKQDQAFVSTFSGSLLLRNTLGTDLSWHEHTCAARIRSVMPRENAMVTGFGVTAGHRFADLDTGKAAVDSAAEAAFQLDASVPPTGQYPVILERRAMTALLATYWGIFSAENAQRRLSLLAGRTGEAVASPCVTLMDDPLLPGGFGTMPFDGEGSASRTKSLIGNGTLNTLLHNRKTARKDGCRTTGNAGRGGYGSPVTVTPTNLFFLPGNQSLESLMAGMGSGIVVTEVTGLHAGANTVSGDFSLLSKGYTVENGKRGHNVERMTVSGNFYRLLQSVTAFADDLNFAGSSIASPSCAVGVLTVSGC